MERLVTPFSGFRALFFVPGDRRDARLGRPVVLRAVRPECPAEAPRSVRGQPTLLRSPWQSGRERQEALRSASPCQTMSRRPAGYGSKRQRWLTGSG